MTNPFSNTLTRNAWEWPVALMSLILGVMISMAWISKTNRESRFGTLDPDLAKRLASGQIDESELQKLSGEVHRLQIENTQLQNTMAGRGKESKVLNDSLQQIKAWAGLTPAEGPGITVTLRDSQKEQIPELDRIIHDSDVLRVVNELWASGAEAIEINGNRIACSSSIRCVGPVIHVDARPIASPVMIRSIGTPETLYGAINLPGGVLEEIRNVDSEMVQVDRVKLHHFNAYAGPTTREHLKIPKETP